MRVLYLNPAANLGGAERSLIDLIVATRRQNASYHPSVLLFANGPLLDVLNEHHIPTKVAPLPAVLAAIGDRASRLRTLLRASVASARSIGSTSRFLAEARSVVTAGSFDLIHSNGIKSHLLSGLIIPQTTPVVCHVRDFVSSRRLVSRLLATVVPRRALFIANSRAVANDVRLLAGNPMRVVAIYNGVDTDYFSPTLAGEKSRPGELVRVGLVATYARWKGQDVFIRAVASLAPEARAAARFYIVGGPIYQTAGSQWSEAELRALAKSNGVESDIQFVPFQADAASIYHNLDVVVHASTAPEPFGRTIIEAMACGKAVIVAQVGGAAELFESEKHALGIVPGDPVVLAAAIQRLVMNPDLRSSLAASARPHVIQKFGLNVLGNEMVTLYRKLLAGKGD